MNQQDQARVKVLERTQYQDPMWMNLNQVHIQWFHLVNSFRKKQVLYTIRKQVTKNQISRWFIVCIQGKGSFCYLPTKPNNWVLLVGSQYEEQLSYQTMVTYQTGTRQKTVSRPLVIHSALLECWFTLADNHHMERERERERLGFRT